MPVLKIQEFLTFQDSEYVGGKQGFEYVLLNLNNFWISLGFLIFFWIKGSIENTRHDFEYAWFWIWQSFECARFRNARVTQGSQYGLIIPEYAYYD